MKKIFLTCLAILLCLPVVAAAQVNVAVEVVDSSRHQDFDTATYLEQFLGAKFAKKNIVQVVGDNYSDEVYVNNFSEKELGELLIFDAVELPVPSEAVENFNAAAYRRLGADYVVRCEVLALGVNIVDDKFFNTLVETTSGALAIAGMGSGGRAETLDNVSFGIGLLALLDMKRTALNNVVKMQLISVDTGKVLLQEQIMGQALKHHKPGKNYGDAWTRAYAESIENSAKKIAKCVNKYAKKNIINGKDE